MPSSLRNLLIVLGRWPRRLAAAVCLVLAGASALAARAQPSDPTAAPTPPPSTSAPAPDRLGVPVHVRGSPGYLHVGDRVDLIAAPPEPAGMGAVGAVGAATTPPAPAASVVATGLLVLRADSADGASSGAGIDLVVAADRSAALRIAALGSGEVIAATVSSP